MKVYKFGGASVKDAENIRNVARILLEQKRVRFMYCYFCNGKDNESLRAAGR